MDIKEMQKELNQVFEINFKDANDDEILHIQQPESDY